MTGLTKKYKESLKNTPGPIPLRNTPIMKIDYKALIAYAKERGVVPGELSDAEKYRFVSNFDIYETDTGWAVGDSCTGIVGAGATKDQAAADFKEKLFAHYGNDCWKTKS